MTAIGDVPHSGEDVTFYVCRRARMRGPATRPTALRAGRLNLFFYVCRRARMRGPATRPTALRAGRLNLFFMFVAVLAYAARRPGFLLRKKS